MTLVVRTVEEVRRSVASARREGSRIALVPTMGALHEGHCSLIRAARAECGFVVVWLFVNPTQFGPSEDLSRYPRPFEDDLERCRAEGADVLFAPSVEVVYPQGHCTFVEVRELQDVLEGASRPGHFRGVCTVVLKMLNMVSPDAAYFGRKDAQQAIVVRRMIRDLDLPVEMRICPTIREADGLALSSRNQYLSDVDRARAVVLIRALRAGRDAVVRGERSPEVVSRTMADVVRNVPEAILDYAVVVDAATLRVPTDPGGIVLLAIAVRLGTTRLIDNLVLRIAPDGVEEIDTLP